MSKAKNMKTRIYVTYYTGTNGAYKESKRVFKSYRALYSQLNTFKDIRNIKINVGEFQKIVTGHYNVIEHVTRCKNYEKEI